MNDQANDASRRQVLAGGVGPIAAATFTALSRYAWLRQRMPAYILLFSQRFFAKPEGHFGQLRLGAGALLQRRQDWCKRRLTMPLRRNSPQRGAMNFSAEQ